MEPVEEEKPKKPKIIEYIEPEKNYLQENMKKLRDKKKTTKKIGGIAMDEEQFKAMLKSFNVTQVCYIITYNLGAKQEENKIKIS